MTTETLSKPPVFADPADNGNHAPEADHYWQESSLFTWHDQATRSGGMYRLGIHPHRGTASIYTWTVIDGEFADRRFLWGQPQPAGEITEMTIGGVTVSTVAPMADYRVDVQQGELDLSFRWRPYVPPMMHVLSTPGSGAQLAKGHYNTMGRAEVTGTFRGKPVNIAGGGGFMDHSWGKRQGIPLGTRWLYASFGPDFCIMVLQNMTEFGCMVKASYVIRDGRVIPLSSDTRIHMIVGDNAYSPEGCHAVIHDVEGNVYHVEGRIVTPTSVYPWSNSFLTHGTARFECEGRVGEGMLECSNNFQGPPAWEMGTLGLAPGTVF